MINYYGFEIIPIILDKFEVNNIIVTGTLDDETQDVILKYCNDTNSSFTQIDSNNWSVLDRLSSFSDYEAIFLNDDPNWYVVLNELNIIKNSNNNFPLVFICHNIFPHKRRDSYINPNSIPPEYRNDYSEKLIVTNCFKNGFYQAETENTSKNGVLTAIEDFLNENNHISIMDFKLINGIIILYPKNETMQLKLVELDNEIEFYSLDNNVLSDCSLEDQFFKKSILNNNNDFESIDDFKMEISEKDKIISDYENKLKVYDSELSYKDSQIDGFDSKLNLKEFQIKNIESKLLNRENEINDLNIQIKSLKKDNSQKDDVLKSREEEFNSQVNSLKSQLNQKDDVLKSREEEFNSQVNSLKSQLNRKDDVLKSREGEFNSQVNSLKSQLNQKEQIELNLNKNLEDAKYNQLNTENELNLIKKQYYNKLSDLDSKEYCIGCYKEELSNNYFEIQYLKENSVTKKMLSPLTYLFLISKSNLKDIPLNLRLYRILKNSNCFDIGFYLKNNPDICDSKWCKYFSPELHYVCHGFNENRNFNKKYFNKKSKQELLDYILNYG